MLLIIKIKHNNDFTIELKKAKIMAELAINNRISISTVFVKHGNGIKLEDLKGIRNNKEKH